MSQKTVFICADHGLSVIYFLQSEVVPTLLSAGIQVVVFTDDVLVEDIQARFGQPGFVVEGMRLTQANLYTTQKSPELQWWLNFLRRVGSSNKINTAAMDSYVKQVAVEEGWKRRILMPIARLSIALLRRSQRARKTLVRLQKVYNPRLYADLFDHYQPSLVATSTFGWRQDRYLLREAVDRGIKTVASIVGWDNPSSYGLSCTRLDWVNCWSHLQKEELVNGSDWPAERVHIGGIPSYDGYFRGTWLIPREQYFHQHGLDRNRKLISYAASFVSFAPNYKNIEALARLVASDGLYYPAQLLVRLHPNHFWNNALFSGERQKIHQMSRELPHIHIVEPVPLGGSLGYYSGEDMPEKASMMAHSDVFTTVYSTMVVEAAAHDVPIVSACLDTPGGWNTPRKFSLPLSQIGNWPTHSRFRQANAGIVALDERELREALDACLKDPAAQQKERRDFIARECTYTDGSAGKRTGKFLLTLLGDEKR
jgi:hypothetical protein